MQKPSNAAATLCLLLASFSLTFAQTTAFTYQGKLTDAGNPANGTYDLQFRLFDALISGNQVGATIVREDVPVASGIFTTTLDFGATAFTGANRFLEIAVRPGASTGAFTILAPLQPITATPYAIQSLNATNATTATSFNGVLAGDVTGTQSATSVIALRGKVIASTPPATGQVLKFNSTTNQYEPTNDNNSGGTITGVTAGTGISGGGTSGNVTVGIAASGVGNIELANNAVTSAKIGAGQVLKSLNSLTDNVTLAAGNNITITPAGNTLTIGATIPPINSILNQTTQQPNASFNVSGNGTAGGTLSGNVINTTLQYNIGGTRILSNTGVENLFVGASAGASNTFGQQNTFVGVSAGQLNTEGGANAFFGNTAGQSNTSGAGNAFFGFAAGAHNTAGIQNSFFGINAGRQNTTGGFNAFFGQASGLNNSTGESNAFFGASSGVGNTTGQANAFFGTSSGYQNTTGQQNAFFGANAGNSNTTSCCNAFFGFSAGTLNSSGGSNTFIGSQAGDTNTTGSNNTIVGSSADSADGLINATSLGANSYVTQSNSLVLGSIASVNSAIADTKVGIGTTAPKTKLDVTGGDILVGSPGQGLILKSLDGSKCTKLSIDNNGDLQINKLAACP